MTKLIYHQGEPPEGTPTLGVVFHIVWTKLIKEETALEPIGYVIEDPNDSPNEPPAQDL